MKSLNRAATAATTSRAAIALCYLVGILLLVVASSSSAAAAATATTTVASTAHKSPIQRFFTTPRTTRRIRTTAAAAFAASPYSQPLVRQQRQQRHSRILSLKRLPLQPSKLTPTPFATTSTGTSTSANTFALASLSIPAEPFAMATSTTTTLLANSLLALHHPVAGIAALTVLSAAIVLPITQYKNIYGVSVGYGTSVAAMAMFLQSTFAPSLLSLPGCFVAATIFYGLRLASYLLLRELTSNYHAGKISKLKEPSRIARIPFAVCLSLFYAFMLTPLLTVLRHQYMVQNTPTAALAAVTSPLQDSIGKWFGIFGVSLAWMGAILENVADSHKLMVKSNSTSAAATTATAEDTKSSTKSKQFTGPTMGVYRMTRHPNYTGEVLFWLGSYLTALPSFVFLALHTSTRLAALCSFVCSSLGLYGIVTIMVKATAKLEQKQADKYAGQAAYEEWKAAVKAPLLPFVYSSTSTKSE